MKLIWKRDGVGVYRSDLCVVLREEGGWAAFRPLEPAPGVYEAGFYTADAAKRWAEKHVPALLAKKSKRTA